jgi:hypothetical protein
MRIWRVYPKFRAYRAAGRYTAHMVRCDVAHGASSNT